MFVPPPRANAPSWGGALVLARYNIYADNHEDVLWYRRPINIKTNILSLCLHNHQSYCTVFIIRLWGFVMTTPYNATLPTWPEPAVAMGFGIRGWGLNIREHSGEYM